jgi:hypothetical protein
LVRQFGGRHDKEHGHAIVFTPDPTKFLPRFATWMKRHGIESRATDVQAVEGWSNYAIGRGDGQLRMDLARMASYATRTAEGDHVRLSAGQSRARGIFVTPRKSFLRALQQRPRSPGSCKDVVEPFRAASRCVGCTAALLASCDIIGVATCPDGACGSCAEHPGNRALRAIGGTAQRVRERSDMAEKKQIAWTIVLKSKKAERPERSSFQRQEAREPSFEHLGENNDDADGELSIEQRVAYCVARDDEEERRRERLERCPGAFVIEGQWGWSFQNGRPASVRELLKFAQLRFGRRGVPFIHRRVTTRTQLRRALREWRSETDYPLLVLETHGAPGHVYLDGDGEVEVPLPELAELIGPYCGANRYVHFGGCEVTKDKRAVERFQRATGVGSVSGHEEKVRWGTACAETLRVLAELAGRTLS